MRIPLVSYITLSSAERTTKSRILAEEPCRPSGGYRITRICNVDNIDVDEEKTATIHEQANGRNEWFSGSSLNSIRSFYSIIFVLLP